MAEFPAQPLPAAEFFEQWLPRAFSESELPPEAAALEARLGVRLEGEGGGEWLFRVSGGTMRVEPGSRAEASFTVVQSVADWRGALWENRGGAIGKQAAAFFRPGGASSAPTRPGAMAGPPSAAALAQMEKLNGVIRMVVAGGEGGDWRVDFKLGPGEIPAEPTTTLTLSAEDAAAMERGELDPMQAFMSGRLQVAGDMTLMMQMQAIQMQAQTQAAQAKPASGS
jgi:hypothetical protein